MSKSSTVESIRVEDTPKRRRPKLPQSLRVLLVEDNPDDAKMMLRELKRAGFEVTSQRVDTEAAFQESIKGDLDLILTDYTMPEFHGMRALTLLKMNGLDIPFIIVSGTIGEDLAERRSETKPEPSTASPGLPKTSPGASQRSRHNRQAQKMESAEKDETKL